MFVQVITGKATDTEALRARLQQWFEQLRPGADGWVGTTAGVADDGTFVAMAAFESEEAARANSERAEQGQWWAATEPLIENPHFMDSTDARPWLGGPDPDAKFVQVMQGRVLDEEAAEAMMSSEMDAAVREARPDVIGGLVARHGDRFTQAVFFTDEAAAREGEKRMDEQGGGPGEEFDQALGDLTFTDLRDPWLYAP